MYHSITFGDKNTWDDWRLVPSSRPLFNPPAQKVKTLDIPGGDGLIDLSTSLTGYPVFQNRTGSFEFIVMNDFKPWQDAYSDIMAYLHGKTMRAVLEDDPGYFYEGRFTVNSWKSQKDWSRITIDYNVNPYKWANELSTDSWLWDSFSFQNGVILSSLFENIEVSTQGQTLTFAADLFGTAPISPDFIVRIENEKVVKAELINESMGLDILVDLPNGETRIPEFVTYGTSGIEVKLRVDSSTATDTATVAIKFRQGRL